MHVKAPALFVVIVVPIDVPTEQTPVGVKSTPWKATIAPESTVKPKPVTVIRLPPEPRFGDAVIVSMVTVNVPVAVCPTRPSP